MTDLRGRRAFLRTLEASEAPPGVPAGAFGVFDAKSLRLAGTAWLSPDPEGSARVMRLTLRVPEPVRGGGHGAEAGSLLVEHALRRLKLHRIEARIAPGERATRRTLQRLGFRYEGLLRKASRSGTRWLDQECWGLLREDRRKDWRRRS